MLPRQRLNSIQQGMAVRKRQFPVAIQDVIDDRRHDVIDHFVDIERQFAARFSPRDTMVARCSRVKPPHWIG